MPPPWLDRPKTGFGSWWTPNPALQYGLQAAWGCRGRFQGSLFLVSHGTLFQMLPPVSGVRVAKCARLCAAYSTLPDPKALGETDTKSNSERTVGKGKGDSPRDKSECRDWLTHTLHPFAITLALEWCNHEHVLTSGFDGGVPSLRLHTRLSPRVLSVFTDFLRHNWGLFYFRVVSCESLASRAPKYCTIPRYTTTSTCHPHFAH